MTELKRIFPGDIHDMPEMPERLSPPPSGFVDEPEVYDEVNVEGQDSEEILVVVDPVKTEVIAEIDLPVEEE